MTPGPFVARWDLDKTYLRSEFDSFRDLLRSALERADQKRTVPGAATLLRELGRAGARVFILSGSPRQMRGRIEAKLHLDGVSFERLTLKPNLENMLKLRLRAVRDQLGYKLPTLLEARATLSKPTRDDGAPLPEILLGDDAEADAFIYALYADLCAGAVDDHVLEAVMHQAHSYDADRARALRWLHEIPKLPIVRRILIHLERQSSPRRFAPFGARVTPFYNYFQAAVVLLSEGLLPRISALRVAVELIREHRFDGEALYRSILDLARRGRLAAPSVEQLLLAAAELKPELPPSTQQELDNLCRQLERGDLSQPARVEVEDSAPPDYISLVHTHLARRSKWGGLLDS